MSIGKTVQYQKECASGGDVLLYEMPHSENEARDRGRLPSKKLTQVFRKHLNKVPVEEVEFKLALEKVKALYEHEQEKRPGFLGLARRIKLGDDADSESNSAGDSRADAAATRVAPFQAARRAAAGGCRTIREEKISIEEDPDDDVQA
ncbi:hypothetical protein HPB51_027780 [Rhipicephalus microplus]|uniref:Uncharacterized protein n=1 Tax=Rhipicephalus microplus TaxID=6941 RepID=A0A9J6CZ01_RHIMP|nr:hypothetical protein HPB51_029118 [Rhipicephalus microplus]KAH7963982.1 hypothetical protein HPB51_027780 [Rhipicephalus microplus]